ncbi:MAG TPA: formate dehydrogenase accessory sulfurtransferase FdhD, partial [Rectinemataceae bacterium]
MDELAALSRRMFGSAELYARTGGMHIAALAAGSRFIAREDVGRHNAVDKVLGRALLDGIDLGGSILLTSGRIASDMAAKAINAGIPLLASRSIPTTEAFSLAVDAGLTLVGRLGSASPIVYTSGERVLADQPDLSM